MPAFQAAKTIAEAAVSVFCQAHADLKLIIVADDDLDYASFLPRDPRLVVLKTEGVGLGPSRARNIGLDYAQSPFVAFLDADDVWDPHKLQVLLPAAYAHGVALDNSALRLALTKPSCFTLWNHPASGFYDFPFFAQVGQSLWPLYRRDRLYPHRFIETLRFAEDAVFHLALIAQNQGAYLHSAPLHTRRIHQDSVTKSTGACQTADEAYAWILAQLALGVRLGFPPDTRDVVQATFTRRQVLNAAFAVSGQEHFEYFEIASRGGVHPFP